MDFTLILLLQFIVAIATIILFSLGLAIVFGMMGVINLAHGEFIMLGAYGALKSHQAGLNFWVAMLVVAPLVAGIYGHVVERLLIRPLYGRLIDTLLATWGLSLFTVGAVTLIFGNTAGAMPTRRAPCGSAITAWVSTISFSSAPRCWILAATSSVLKKTNAGTLARATMQDADMVAALGYNPRAVYSVTFAIGTALAGLAGGLLAPITGVIPSMGAAFVTKAFISVISGGSAIILGTGTTAAILGSVNQFVTFLSTPVVGEAAFLVAAIMLLRILPNGLSDRFFRGGV